MQQRLFLLFPYREVFPLFPKLFPSNFIYAFFIKKKKKTLFMLLLHHLDFILDIILESSISRLVSILQIIFMV